MGHACTECYTSQGPDWGIEEGRKGASRKDRDEKLALVFEGGYEAWGYLIEGVHGHRVRDQVAKIEATVTNRIFQLQLAVQPDKSIHGIITGEVHLKI